MEKSKMVADHNTVETVKRSLKEGLDPTLNASLFVKLTITRGNLDVLEVLLDDPRVDSNWVFRWSVIEGHLKAAQLLIDRGVDPSAGDNWGAMMHAVEGGKRESVKFLLDDGRIDPNDLNRAHSIRYAKTSGYIEIIKLLFNDPRFEIKPSECDHELLRMIEEKEESLAAVVFCCKNMGDVWPDLIWIIKDRVKWY